METKCENIYKENFPFWDKISDADREYICRNSHMLTYSDEGKEITVVALLDCHKPTLIRCHKFK